MLQRPAVEEMLFVKFLPGGAIRQETLAPGHHYVEIALNEVPMFIRRGRCVPLAEPAETVGAVDASRTGSKRIFMM